MFSVSLWLLAEDLIPGEAETEQQRSLNRAHTRVTVSGQPSSAATLLLLLSSFSRHPFLAPLTAVFMLLKARPCQDPPQTQVSGFDFSGRSL